MMVLNIYRGKYVTAESAENYIDVEGVKKLCHNLRESAEDLKDIGKKIDSAKSSFKEKYFSLNGYSYEESCINCSDNHMYISKYLEDMAENLENGLNRTLKKLQNTLNEDARELEQKKANAQNIELKA